MAYKFQVGVAQLSGNLTQEGALTAEGLASLDGGIDVNGANFTVSTAGAVGAAGLASLDGGIDVNGNLTVSTAGAVAGATTISGSGLATSHALASGQGNFTVSSLGVMVAGASTLGSLNNSNGGITNAGAISQATTISGSGLATSHALASGQGSFTVSAAGHLVSPSGSITDLLVSDDFQVVGDSRFDGDVALISSTTASFGLHILNSVGLVVGATGQFQVDPSNGDVSTSGDVTGSAFNFAKGSDFAIAQNLLPDRASALDLGSSARPYQAVYADTFIGNIAFDTQTVTDFGPVAAASDIVYVNMASTGRTLELPTGSAGKVLRIKMSGERPFQISGAAGTGDTVFDQPADSILVMMEALGAALTCVYSGSAGSGKWHII